jgi:GT2 family glycosyltransferase
MIRMDIVTVYHCQANFELHKSLFDQISQYEPDGGLRLIGVDNRVKNRGFAAGCNLGALHPEATAPVIGFLNPDVTIKGPFVDRVTSVLNDQTVITGCRFGKADRELKLWGVHDWVCGATFFVHRKWFKSVGGFDEQFTWSHEETDLIRQAEAGGHRCLSIRLPLLHSSPARDSPQDAAYKSYHFAQAQRRFLSKWARPSQAPKGR